MDLIFWHIRRYARLIVLILLGLILLKMLCFCTVLDVIMLIGLILILIALVCSPC